MKKVLIFPASQRSQSINQRLADYLADSLIAEVQIDLLTDVTQPADVEVQHKPAGLP